MYLWYSFNNAASLHVHSVQVKKVFQSACESIFPAVSDAIATNHFDFLVRSYQGSHQNSLDVPGAFERDAGFQQLLEVGRYLSIVLAVQPSWENAMEDVGGPASCNWYLMCH